MCPWMYIPAKKLNARSPRLAAATATAPHTGLYATDEKTSIPYLVDTGACVSIIPASSAQQQFPDFKTSLTLTAANGTSLPTYGTTTRTFQLNGCAYEWKFTLAQTSVPLLGADFFAHHGLMVDLRHGRLVDPEAIMAVQLQRNPAQQPVNTSHVNSTPYQHVIDSFRDVFRPQLKHNVGQHLNMGCIITSPHSAPLCSPDHAA